MRCCTICEIAKLSVHFIRLGCARNDVDAEELAARLALAGFDFANEPAQADIVLVNTCGFIDAAKKDSIDQLLAAADLKGQKTQRVVAVGCLAERYGEQLAQALPETDAVLGFDDYPQIAAKLQAILRGESTPSHQPRDRRELLPITPVARQSSDMSGGFVPRQRLDTSPSTSLKIASGCDRRCAFCAIPAIRGRHLSRPVDQILAEARWLVASGCKEIMLVSENTTAYGKDLGIGLADLLLELDQVPDISWIRTSYLQPAELHPAMIDAICGAKHVVSYFDIPFQHAAAGVLRRMQRFGDPDSFLGLLDSIRERDALAGIRSNFIVGFPGETSADLELLAQFLEQARLDAIGIFAFSAEEGTLAASLPDQLDDDEIAARVEWLSDLSDELVTQRAEERIGERVQLLIEQVSQTTLARAAHQGPEVDGIVIFEPDEGLSSKKCKPGDLVWGKVKANYGVDLIVREER